MDRANYKSDSDNGKAVLITGCSSGIGRNAATTLAERGFRVFATARSAQDVDVLTALGLEALPLDVDDTESIRQCVGEVLHRCDGRLYGLVNNAGFGTPGALEDISRDDLRRQFETNVFGAHEMVTSVLPAMRAAGEGRIVQISSVLGLVSLAYRGAYNASKYALEGLSDTLRLELADTNIYVSSIAPGPIGSRFRENAFAHYQQTVDTENSAHRDAYRKLAGKFERGSGKDPFSLGPEAVVRRIVHALESKRPKPRYYVTVPAILFSSLKRLLPTRTLDRVLLYVSRGELRK
jgi:NAD(P)-dependent dehydrogenase (short-subunit alcohol dehydrogenase family)